LVDDGDRRTGAPLPGDEPVERRTASQQTLEFLDTHPLIQGILRFRKA